MAYLFQHVNLLDGKLDETGNMPVQEDVSVLVDGQKIVGIYKTSEEIKGNWQIVDLQDKYMIPGLINLHVHLFGPGIVPDPQTAKPVLTRQRDDVLAGGERRQKVLESTLNLLKNHLYSGVTTLREVGGLEDIDGDARDRINSENAIGPRMLVCNKTISVRGGHGWQTAEIPSSPEEAREAVDRVVSTHPDWIKIMITGGVADADEAGEPGRLRMPLDIATACCERAHELGFKVAAHIESPLGVKVGLESGVDTIEHGAKPDAEIIRLFQEKKAAHVCTISPALPYALFPDSITHSGDIGRINGGTVMHGIIDCARACLDNDIPVGLGNDSACNFVTAYDFWLELDYFVKHVHVSPAFAIYTATRKNAEILHLEDEIGTVEAGKTADFLIAEENPLLDLANLRDPVMVVHKGQIIDHPVIDHLADTDQILDQYRNM